MHNRAASTVLPTEAIRTHFPALARRHVGELVAYFDGPGGTQVPRAVVDAMADYLLNHNANTHWAFPTSVETDAILANARSTLADLLNADPDEIAFGQNMTSLTFHLARAIGRGLTSADALVVTELDHMANVAPWRALERERGVALRVVQMDPSTGTLDLDDLARHLEQHPRPKLLAIGAASNALGTITDVTAATQMAHNAGALVFVDAVHAVPHTMMDVKAIGCDFLACSAYKFHGPHVGVLFGRRELVRDLDVPRLPPAPDTAPERLETGTQNHEGIAGAAAAVEFLASLADGITRRERLALAYEALHKRGQLLVTDLWEGLGAIGGIRLFGPPPDQPRTPTVSFTLADMPSAEVARLLAERGLFVSHGDFYASTAVERLGQARDGLVRVGCAAYTMPDEVDRLVSGVAAIAAGR